VLIAKLFKRPVFLGANKKKIPKETLGKERMNVN
jgi:hypothetical protein